MHSSMLRPDAPWWPKMALCSASWAPRSARPRRRGYRRPAYAGHSRDPPLDGRSHCRDPALAAEVHMRPSTPSFCRSRRRRCSTMAVSDQGRHGRRRHQRCTLPGPCGCRFGHRRPAPTWQAEAGDIVLMGDPLQPLPLLVPLFPRNGSYHSPKHHRLRLHRQRNRYRADGLAVAARPRPRGTSNRRWLP